jgi:hypothetical protein
MTFLEAAIEVLRYAEEPLHFSAIAKAAVDRNLLSHVGRDPEAAMRSCLNSAVRGGSSALVERSKPGHYRIRPGAKLPEPAADPPAEESAEAETEAEAKPAKTKAKKSTKKTRSRKKATKSGDDGAKKSTKKTRSRKKADDAEAKAKAKAEAPEGESAPSGEDSAAGEGSDESEAGSKVEFEAPTGSGLEGVTDVAIVMANAMSRLAEERPELREELEAMQQRQQESAEQSGPIIQTKPTRARREEPEDRGGGGRRRRRRRRRARRVEWSGGSSGRDAGPGKTQELLDKVAAVLAEAGPRSLHIRQVAETLAAQNVLGGEISEIERAVTSAVLVDVKNRGRASRFAVRGDARYQLQGSRVPEGAAKAEKAFRDAVLTLEKETRSQLIGWLGSLGARALESLVRIYLQREGYNLVATLPPGRGLGKLVAEDPDGDEEEGKALVLVVPRRTSLEPKLWDGEAERNQCGSTLVFSMGDGGSDRVADARVLYAPDLADWLLRHGIGVNRVRVEVPVLDANVIESIGGLDT